MASRVSLLPRVTVNPMARLLSHAGLLVSATWFVAGTNIKDAKSVCTLLSHQSRLVLVCADAKKAPANRIKAAK